MVNGVYILDNAEDILHRQWNNSRGLLLTLKEKKKQEGKIKDDNMVLATN